MADKNIELTIHFYNKPQSKPKRSKILVQGGNKFNQSLLHLYVFEELPVIYKEVCKKMTPIANQSQPSSSLSASARVRNCTKYSCDECEYSTPKGALLRIHIQKKHNVKNPDIIFVPSTPKNDQNLTCDLCDYKYTYPDQLKAHVKNVHDNINEDITLDETCEPPSVKDIIQDPVTPLVEDMFGCDRCESDLSQDGNLSST